MGWRKFKTCGRTITDAVREQVEKAGQAKLIGHNEKVVDNWQDYKISKKSNYILYERES